MLSCTMQKKKSVRSQRTLLRQFIQVKYMKCLSGPKENLSYFSTKEDFPLLQAIQKPSFSNYIMLKFTENMPQKYLSSATILVRLSPLRTLYEYGRWRGDSAILYSKGFSCSRLLSMHLGHTHPSLLLLLCYIVLSREWQRSLFVPSRRERVQFLTYTKEEEGCTCK